jgi:signal transduction histidine kinase
MYELFAPLYESKTGRMIAVGEFYQDAGELVKRTNEAIRLSWVVVSTIGVSLWLFLLVLVRAGSTTIEKQKRLLKQQLREQSRLRLNNNELAGQIRSAMCEVERIDTQIEREVALDLHDGAAQLLSFALLKLDLLEEAALMEPARGELVALRNVLNDALQDIRSIAGGLFLPQTENADIVTVVRAVIDSYTRLTGRSVKAALDDPSGPIDSQTVRCVARVAREALANGFKHAAGVGQEISLKFHADRLTIAISDDGPGLTAEPQNRVGLRGMVARVQALNGQLSTTNKATKGTIVTVSIPLSNRL